MRVYFKSAIIQSLLAIAVVFTSAGQPSGMTFERVEPAFWWVGMKHGELQILFYHHQMDLSGYAASLDYPGVSLTETIRVSNAHYLFLKLLVSPTAQAGKINIRFTAGKKSFTYSYELRNKSTDSHRIQGFNTSDVVYLIMPDRFANGDLKNDSLAGFYQGAHRDQPFGRHGGDLKGISDHLPYLKELGITTLWLNPVLENNQKRESYHGYAITDLYRVDARLGTNDSYRQLIEQAHQAGLKVIQDMVMNHVGQEHWLIRDLPDPSWIHQFPRYTASNYRGGVVPDIHKSKFDSMIMVNGWFDTHMPDVAQTNPLFADYLIQNSIWWIEYAGIDGIRMDTYPYPDKYFMARWAKTLTDEYPRFGLVGEVWLNAIPSTAYWQKGARNADGYNSFLPSVTDFPFCFAVPRALNETSGWDTGVTRLYDLLSQDFQYPDANQNLTFLDNHDMTRFFRTVGNDLNKFKMGLTFLLTTRGIPQLYYGTEVLMDGDGSVHPQVRRDFPGGWPGDSANYFKGTGMTADQQEAMRWIKKLLHWRKINPAIYQGKLTHFVPRDNVYVYFRTLGSATIMVLMNGNDTPATVATDRFQELMAGRTTATDVLNDRTLNGLEQIQVPGRTALVLELH